MYSPLHVRDMNSDIQTAREEGSFIASIGDAACIEVTDVPKLAESAPIPFATQSRVFSIMYITDDVQKQILVSPDSIRGYILLTGLF